MSFRALHEVCGRLSWGLGPLGEVGLSSRGTRALRQIVATRPPEAQRESRLVRLSLRFALRPSDYGSIFPKEKVRTSVPGGCWMCSTTFVYVRDVRRTDQFPFEHSVFALGGVGAGMFGEKVIWPL